MSERDKPTLAVGVSVLITMGGCLLLGERINCSAAGLLSTPGGRIEQNEDMFAAAIRETAEETGITLERSDLEVMAFREHFRFGGHYIMFYFHVDFGSSEGSPPGVENREPEKCKGWRWVPLPEVAACTEPLSVLIQLTKRMERKANG